MRKLVVDIVEHSRPSCGLDKECVTKCGECGADHIYTVLLDWMAKHCSKTQLELFESEWKVQ
uniref:Uncharacterized protein n=1 Tax=viral metagenome TaxID=1070528 RepID=A0A6H1ZGE4_9ZZZZ